jgi:hypothetical protein
LFPPKGSYSKAKITPVYNDDYCCYRVESEGDVPAEVSSQIEAVNEESVNESSASEKKVVRLLSLINQHTKRKLL